MTYWNDWDGQTRLYCYQGWTDLLMYKNDRKRHSYIQNIYRHVLYIIQGCFLSQFGSINIKESRSNLNVGGTVITSNNSILFENIVFQPFAAVSFPTPKRGKTEIVKTIF